MTYKICWLLAWTRWHQLISHCFSPLSITMNPGNHIKGNQRRIPKDGKKKVNVWNPNWRNHTAARHPPKRRRQPRPVFTSPQPREAHSSPRLNSGPSDIRQAQHHWGDQEPWRQKVARALHHPYTPSSRIC